MPNASYFLLQFDIKDKLPKFFCESCITSLRASYQFKAKCEYAYKKLLALHDPTAYLEYETMRATATNSIGTITTSSYSKLMGFDITTSNTDYPFSIPAASSACELCSCSIEIEISPVKLESVVNETSIKCVPSVTSPKKKSAEFKPIIVNCQTIQSANEPNTLLKPKNETIAFTDFAFVGIAAAPELENTIVEDPKDDIDVQPAKVNSNEDLGYLVTETHLETDKALDPPEWYECSMCDGKKFFSRSFFLRHIDRLHVGDKVVDGKFACMHCHQLFAVKKLLIKHTRTHMGFNKAKPKCHHCGKFFSITANLNRHIDNVHKGLKPFQCTLCLKHFTQKTSLDGHMTIHTGERKFKCTECSDAFKNRNDLNRHKICHMSKDQQNIYRKLHKNSQNRHYRSTKICEICGKVLRSYHTYKHHMASHNDRKEFKCTVCQKEFRMKLSLNVHMRSHNNDRPYQCETCGNKFRQIAHLRVHKRLHTGEKPFKCRFCDKAFIATVNYREHVRTHTGERPYICKLCNSNFANLHSFKRHLASLHPYYDKNETDENGDKILAYIYRPDCLL